MYINCHSYYSFKYGTISPETLLTEAKNNDFNCIALTDINNTSGVLDFVRMAGKYGVKPVVGIDFKPQKPIPLPLPFGKGDRAGRALKGRGTGGFVGLARNNEGFKELNDFLSYHLHNKIDLPEQAPVFFNSFVIYPFTKTYRLLRENEFIGVRASELIHVQFTEWKKHPDKLVMLAPVTFRNKVEFNTHRLLRAIDKNIILSKLEKSEEAQPDEIMLHRYELIKLYGDNVKIIDNTVKLLDACSIDFAFGKNKNKKTFTGNIYEDELLLKRLCKENLPYRYPKAGKEIIERYDKEIKAITEQGYSSYFLINWDIVRYAQHKGFYYVGRGSGANSMVAYLLRITDVDPIDLDLYFERFINAYRTSPPDFDLDFSWKDRDEIKAYMFKTHGSTHTAQLATYSTFQSNAIIRELGKVFGLPKAEIDDLAENKQSTTTPDNITKLIYKYSKHLHDMPSYLSVHAGGILISELPMHYYTATTLACADGEEGSVAVAGFPLTQFSMLEAEDVGLYKFDILSQRGLGHIKESVELVKQNRGVNIDIHDVKGFKADKTVNTRLSEAQCMGCFYIESPAMRMLLRKLEVTHYRGLVAASSIIRPGVASSGMMREYILRFKGMKASYDTPKEIYDILKETYGVMVYQEDVIKVAHYFAGLTLGEADMLRRGMSGKYRGRKEFDLIQDKFFSNCKERKIEDSVSKEVWRQIESFAGYAFSKGHSASYAVESYQSLYLKTYYPLEHMVAVINNFGGFYRTEFYVHEARMLGGIIHSPDINRSEHLTSITGTDIYLGFVHVGELEKNVIEKVLTERMVNGKFQSLEDFANRVDVSIEQIRILIKINSFRFTGRTKQQLMWDIAMLTGSRKKTERKNELFPVPVTKYTLPPLYQNHIYHAWDEIEILGFPLCSPFELIKGALPTEMTAADLKNNKGNIISIVGYMVTIKYATTKHKETMNFGTFIDKNGHFFDTTHFPKVAKEFAFNGKGCYVIKGKVDEEFGFYSITVNEMHRLDMITREDAVAGINT